jgi:hypothetical protein
VLRAIPKSWFSWSFDVSEDGTSVGAVETAWTKERGRLCLGSVTCQLSRRGWLSGAFIVEYEGQVLAEAEKPSAFDRSFIVHYEQREIRLAAASPIRRPFVAREGGAEIGSIRPDHAFTRKTTIDLPGDLILPVRLFMFWLAVLMWRRAARNG